MAQRPTLILDIMGADLGTAEMVQGAALYCAQFPEQEFNLTLVTAEPQETERQAGELLTDEQRRRVALTIVPARDHLPEQIASPVDVYKKHPNSSVRVAMNVARETPSSAVISPGNTGLVMTSALFTIGRVRGIDRTPIATPMPTLGRELTFVDGGSNVDCRPEHLYQFAMLAHIFLKHTRGVEHPSIALISNGSEDYKGNTQVREAAELLRADKDLNFRGYVEGHTLFEGDLDIMVCDGFLGNIVLKLAEGIADAIIAIMREEIKAAPLAAIAAKLFQRKAFSNVKSRLDYTQFGGAPLLGLNGNVVICHGRSPARAIMNALGVGYALAVADMAPRVAQYMAEHREMAAGTVREA